jgi:hypothetical protein
MLRRNAPAWWFVVWLFWTGLALWHHEMWRDEVLPWTMATTADSVSAWLANIRHDPQPKLWHLLLFGISRVTADLRAVQAFHFLVAAATVWLILRKAPFPIADRALLCFGYFLSYEYAVITRSYALSALAAVAYLAVHARPGRTPWLALAAMALTTIHALIVACALGLARALEPRLRSREGLTWLALAVAASVLQAWPPADSVRGAEFGLQYNADRLVYVAATLWKGLVPVPAWRVNFWGSNVLNPHLHAQAALGLAAAAGVACMLRRRPAALSAWIAGAGVLLAFFYTAHRGYVRHFGFLFLLLVACCWLADVIRASRGARWAFRGLLVAHVFAAVTALAADWRFPFSGSIAAAEFLRSQRLDDMPLVGHGSHSAALVAHRLHRPVHFADSGQVGYFVVNTYQAPTDEDDAVVTRAVEHLQAYLPTDVVVLLNHIWASAPPAAGPVFSVTTTIVPSERYYVYRVPAAKSE